MIIEQFYNASDGCICFTREQGSKFAKAVAGDFNPLHDVDAKRFCIPGDLLFAVVLARYGVSQQMEFTFSGMVADGVQLMLPTPADKMHILDPQGKEYLQVVRHGSHSMDAALIKHLTHRYVAFSGETFPHILVPLLAEKNVMLNIARPMVIYASMSINLHSLDIRQPLLQHDFNHLEIHGKRAAVELSFNLVDAGEIVGRGKKHLLVSGLREYEESAMAPAIAQYNQEKAAFMQST